MIDAIGIDATNTLCRHVLCIGAAIIAVMILWAFLSDKFGGEDKE